MVEVISSGERVVCLVSGMLQGPGVVLGHDIKKVEYGPFKEEWVVYLVRDVNTGRVMEIAGDWVQKAGPSCFGSGDIIPNGTRVICNVAGVLRGQGVVLGHHMREVSRGASVDRWVVYQVRDTSGVETEISSVWLEPTH